MIFIKYTLTIEGMSCEHCAKHVTGAILAIEGSESCKVKLKDKTASVKASREISDTQFTEAVSDAGYTLVQIKK